MVVDENTDANDGDEADADVDNELIPDVFLTLPLIPLLLFLLLSLIMLKFHVIALASVLLDSRLNLWHKKVSMSSKK